ncbi:LuxR family transcriptional regulator [Streptomyces fungicidicus]|uniref:LuxR family transcriptional regulator n=1 Tax=Streptomyces TaxID=1883 RepID=UPI0001B4E355|nr:LuxR family transcriptional regulator [Streptomyces griseoflavus]
MTVRAAAPPVVLARLRERNISEEWGHEVCGQSGDDLEHALLQVRELIESTMLIHRDRSRREQLITALPGGHGQLIGVTRELMGQATGTIDILRSRLPGTGSQLERIGLLEADLLHFARERVSARLLTGPDLVGDSLGGWLPDRRLMIRVARLPPLQVLIADRATALVVVGSPSERRASLIKAPEVLLALCTLFESIWHSSASPAEHLAFGDRDRAVLVRQILGAMRAGITDEVAARELTVSVRTYRRYVAEIMALLGASSRFQAGVRAAELGLLPPGQHGTHRP